MAVRQSRGRWTVEFQQAGIRVFRRLPPGITKAQAEEWEVKRRRELFEAGPLGKRPELTLPAAIQLWLENNHRKNQKKALSEAKQWEPFVKGKFLREAPEVAASAVRSWGKASPSEIRRTNGSAATRQASAATINRRLCVLKAAAKYAWKQRWFGQNVSGLITLLPERNRREVYLTKRQVMILAESSPSRETQSAIWIAAYTGLRASELLALPRIGSRQSSLMISPGKTGKARVVPIAGPARPYLSALPLALDYWQLHKQFLAARKKAGMPHLRFHDLRHTCASWLINEGVDLYVVGKILGHSGPQTTARYAHLADKTLKRAMARLK